MKKEIRNIWKIFFSIFFYFASLHHGLAQNKFNKSRSSQNLINSPSMEEKKANFIYSDSIKDLTSYPIFETNISLNLGKYSYRSFLANGNSISYSLRGEKEIFSKCSGDICIIVTNKNFLGISNFSGDWQKGYFLNEDQYKTKFGNVAAFIVTERDLYLYNGLLNKWEEFSLEGEQVLGVSNKNDLACIVTSKHIIAINLRLDTKSKMNTSHRNINAYEIKSDTIFFYSDDKIFKYSVSVNSIELLNVLN